MRIQQTDLGDNKWRRKKKTSGTPVILTLVTVYPSSTRLLLIQIHNTTISTKCSANESGIWPPDLADVM